MAFFQSNTCAAFSWDDQDVFRGVLLQRYGDQIRVQKFWETEKVGNRSRAQIMEQGVPALDANEDTTVIVGGNYSKTCFIDLKMPKLSFSDLKNALSFELSKYSPVPMDELQWGYRIVGKIEGTEFNLVRVIYFPENEWESWVAAASGVSDGVDMIIPPIAVLDPEMEGIDVCLGNKINGNEVYLFKSANEGERQIICLSPEEPLDDVFGGGETPLKKEGFDPGELNQLTADQQKNFGPPILLGMYGLSNAFYSDRKHWLPVPMEMRPRRNRAHKFYTVIVTAYLLFLLCLILSALYIRKNNELQAINAESSQLQAEIETFGETSGPEIKMEELETEVTEINQSIFSMTNVLREITTLTKEKLWCTNFTWDSGDFRLELRASADDPDLTLAFQNSNLITDCTMNKRQLHDGSVNYTINCRAKRQEELQEEFEIDVEEFEEEAEVDLEEEMEEDDEIREILEEEFEGQLEEDELPDLDHDEVD